MFRSTRAIGAAALRTGAAARPAAIYKPASAIPTVALNAILSVKVPVGARTIAKSYLNKKDQAAKEFAVKAEAIRNGEAVHVWDLLNERGLVKDVAGRPSQIRELMRVKRIGAYTGIDPTAESLHIGHILPLMPLFWMYMHGYPTTTILGGATARIGDPTDRLGDRPVISNADISRNITKIHYQVDRLWQNVEDLGRKYGYPGEWAGRHFMWNNNMWLGRLPIYDVMKRIGRDVRIGPMLAKDTVRNKLENGTGMSFAEFTYPLLQGWDFWHVYSKVGVQLQVGGSDQFGNITTGCEILKLCRQNEEAPHLRMPDGWMNDPYGFTVPLLTDSSGKKFGKTSGNAVWLDNTMTSPFDLYAWFVSRADDEVEKYLTMFTFMPLPTIKELMVRHMENPAVRLAQHTLAFEFLSMVHGAEIALREQRQHLLVHGKEPIQMPEGTIPAVLLNRANDPNSTLQPGEQSVNYAAQVSLQLPESLVMGKSIAKIVHACGLSESSSEAQRLIINGGLYVAAAPGQKQVMAPGSLDWTPVQNWFPSDTLKFLIEGRLLILRRGRRNIRIIEIVSDEDWKASGQTYPGEPNTGRLRTLLNELQREAQANGEEISQAQLRKRLVQRMAESGNFSMRESLSIVDSTFATPEDGFSSMPAEEQQKIRKDIWKATQKGQTDRKSTEKNMTPEEKRMARANRAQARKDNDAQGGDYDPSF